MTTTLDDLVSMAIFARVVEAQSFTAASAALNLSKSAVSTRVTALEKQLGVKLLQRTTRRLALTPEGARVYEQCARMLRSADEAAAIGVHASGTPRGLLRVTAPLTFSDVVLSELIPVFLGRYPEVRVDLCVGNGIVDLISGQTDVAIRVAPRLQESSLLARRLASSPKLVCASPAYVRARGAPETPRDLMTHDCLRFSLLPAEEEWCFEAEGGPIIVPVSGRVVADNSEALRRAAIAGIGVVVLPLYYVVRDIIEGRLVTLLETFPLQELGIYVASNYGQLAPARLHVFVEFLTEELRAWEKELRQHAPDARRRRTAL